MMNRTTLTLVLATALGAATTYAQTSTAPVAQPSSPAPAVASVAPAANAVSTAPENPTQIVYTPQLPNVADLTKAANDQGYTVERMVQTGTQIIAFYRNANGQQSTVAYQTLPPSGTASAPASAAVVVTAPPPQTIVYERAPRVVYYEDYPAYYYPRVWYPPVSLSFGFGYRSFHGGYHGGYRHGR